MTRHLASILLSILVSLPIPAQTAEGRLRSIPVRGGVHMLMGRGGNIGIFVGEQGAILIDDQFASEVPRIQAAVAEVCEEPVRFVVNTHWHADHTGGNEILGKAGAIIVAQENMRRRTSVDQFMKTFGRTVPALPPEGRPVITFGDAITFHWNGDEVKVFHVARAHTDGDAIVHFTKADVLHMGDVFFNGMYPFIDVESGGGIDGMIAAVDRVLALCGEETRIIPGHGPLAGREDLKAYRDMLATVRGRIAAAIEKGQSADEVVAAQPTRDFDRTWGRGFLKPERWVRILYASLKSGK